MGKLSCIKSWQGTLIHTQIKHQGATPLTWTPCTNSNLECVIDPKLP